MKNLTLAFSVLLLTITLAQGQPEVEWQRLYGEDRAQEFFQAHIRTVADGWAFAGYTWNPFPSNFWLLVTDDEGDIILNEEYGEAETCEAFDLVQTEDGGYLIGGYFQNRGANQNFGVVRVDAEGNVIWMRDYGDFDEDKCEAVLGQSGDVFVLAGWMVQGGNQQAYLVKIQGNGDVMWEQTYGGDNREAFNDIILVENGYAMAGYTRSFGAGSSDFWLVTVNEIGEMIWNQTYGNELMELCYALVRADDDGFALAGLDLFESVNNAVIVKTNAFGEQMWLQRYVHDDDEMETVLNDIALMPDGGFTAVGRGSINGGGFGFTICVDEDGNLNWERLLNVDRPADEFNSVLLDDDNGITMAGESDLVLENGSDNIQAWFVKLAAADLPPVIISKTPPDSLFRIPRTGSQAFSVNAIDPELQDLTYRWFFEGDTIGDEEIIFLDFPELDTLDLQVFVRDQNWTVSTGWRIMVVPLIAHWSPEDTIFTVDQFAVRDFEIEAGLPFDTLAYRWWYNEEQLEEADTLLQIAFPDTGNVTITVTAEARDVEESLRWHINVIAPDHVRNPWQEPQTFQFDPPHPNPFNNETIVNFSLPTGMAVTVSVYDLAGRMVEKVLEGFLNAGKHERIIDASHWQSGIYILQLKTDEIVRNVKLVCVE